MDLNCPKCKSENTQKITAIVSAGTTRTSGSTSSSSVGVMGGSVGVGSSRGTINATSKTELANKLAKPKPRFQSLIGGMVLFALVGWIPGWIVVVEKHLYGSTETFVYWGIYALLMAGFYKFWAPRAEKNRTYNETEYQTLLKSWENGFFCHRCEHQFLPNGH